MTDDTTDPRQKPPHQRETSDEQVPDDEAVRRDEQEKTIPPQEMDAALADAEGRAMRAQAELENFRKRMRREMEDSQRYAAMPMLRDLLPVVDDMQRAIAAAEKSEDTAGLLAGVKMVESRLRSVLEQHACRRIEAEGAAFDPAMHEAILMQPTTEYEPGQVMQVTQQGYQLHDRVIRPAQVIVAKATEETAE